MKRDIDDLFRIKDLLQTWATLNANKATGGYPKQSAFATERVDSSNRSTDTYYDGWPADIIQLDSEVEKLAPMFKRILALEYLDKRPQKTKAAVVGISREVFSQRVRYMHIQLSYTMYGE